MDNNSQQSAAMAPINGSPRSVQGYSNGHTARTAPRAAARDGLAHQHSAFTPWSPRATVLEPRQPRPTRTSLFPTLSPHQQRPLDVQPPSPATHTLADLPPSFPLEQRHLEQVSSSPQEPAGAAMAAAQDGPNVHPYYMIVPWSSTAVLLPVSVPAQQYFSVDHQALSLQAPAMISPAFWVPPPTARTEQYFSVDHQALSLQDPAAMISPAFWVPPPTARTELQQSYSDLGSSGQPQIVMYVLWALPNSSEGWTSGI